MRFPTHPKVSQNLVTLLERLLTKDPKARINMVELLRDPWVTCEGQYPMRPFKELYVNGRLESDVDPTLTNYLKDMLQLKHRCAPPDPPSRVVTRLTIKHMHVSVTVNQSLMTCPCFPSMYVCTSNTRAGTRQYTTDAVMPEGMASLGSSVYT